MSNETNHGEFISEVAMGQIRYLIDNIKPSSGNDGLYLVNVLLLIKGFLEDVAYDIKAKPEIPFIEIWLKDQKRFRTLDFEVFEHRNQTNFVQQFPFDVEIFLTSHKITISQINIATTHVDYQLTQYEVNAIAIMLKIAEKNILIQQEMDSHRVFAGEMAHKVKTPISLMGMWLDDLETNIEKQAIVKYRRYLAGLKNELCRAEDAVTRFLRVEGRVRLPHDLYDINQLVIATIDAFPLLNELFELTLVTLPEVVFVYVCQEDIQHAIKEILENAVKYRCKNSKPTLKLEIYIERKKTVCISITNEGTGINPKYATEIFNPLSIYKAAGGFGYGMPLAKSLVESNNGVLEVGRRSHFSSIEKGLAEFIVKLPIHLG